jgi:hypothetical protein
MKLKHQELFVTFSATFKPETVEKWEKLVREWEQDNTKVNPYAEPVNSMYFGFHQLRTPFDSRLPLATTERDIRLQMVKEEEAEASRGILPPHDISPSLFLHAGLELEQQQSVIFMTTSCTRLTCHPYRQTQYPTTSVANES